MTFTSFYVKVIKVPLWELLFTYFSYFGFQFCTKFNKLAFFRYLPLVKKTTNVI